MDKRRRVAIFGGGGAAIAASSVALPSQSGPIAGLPADFWRGFPLGVGLVFIIFAVVQFIKWKREEVGRQ